MALEKATESTALIDKLNLQRAASKQLQEYKMTLARRAQKVMMRTYVAEEEKETRPTVRLIIKGNDGAGGKHNVPDTNGV